MNPQRYTETAKMFPQHVQEWQLILEKCKADRSRADEYAEQFITVLEMNFSKNHSCAFYAGQLNTRKDYLYEACRKTLGFSPSRCIQLRLFLESCALLSETRHSIKEIALKLGIEDPVYFSRFYKNWAGMTPKAFRKRIQKNTDQ